VAGGHRGRRRRGRRAQHPLEREGRTLPRLRRAGHRELGVRRRDRRRRV